MNGTSYIPVRRWRTLVRTVALVAVVVGCVWTLLLPVDGRAPWAAGFLIGGGFVAVLYELAHR